MVFATCSIKLFTDVLIIGLQAYITNSVPINLQDMLDNPFLLFYKLKLNSNSDLSFLHANNKTTKTTIVLETMIPNKTQD